MGVGGGGVLNKVDLKMKIATRFKTVGKFGIIEGKKK